jgi:hypothetical protein
MSSRPAALETWTCELPSWVLSRRRAVFAALEEYEYGSNQICSTLAHVSFSKVTVALFGLSAASDAGVTEREVIFPLPKVRNIRFE